MKQLTILLTLLFGTSAFGQILEEYEKNQVYKTVDGRLLSRRFADSIKHDSNLFNTWTKYRETNDSVYYVLKYFPYNQWPDRYKKEGSFCGNSRIKNLEEIKRLTPFNQIASIKMVSFKATYTKTGERIPRAIPKTDDKVDLRKMHEVKILDNDLTDKLLDILVNYDNEGKSMEIAFCYDPRNAIVFLDKSEKVLGYIEICFQCEQFKIEPKTLPVAWFCNEKLEVIKGFFMRVGITLGMNEEVD